MLYSLMSKKDIWLMSLTILASFIKTFLTIRWWFYGNIQFCRCILIQEPFDYNWTFHIFCLQGDNVPDRTGKLKQVNFMLK